MTKALALLAVIAALLLPDVALAHPLGNFTINRYSRIEPLPGSIVRVQYVVDMAEIPTFQERQAAGLDGAGLDQKERYLEAKVAELRSRLALTADGAPVALRTVARTLTFPPGQGGLPTLRLAATFEGDLGVAGRAVRLTYRDDNDVDRLGWKEIVLRPAAGVPVWDSTASTQDRSDALRRYPEDMLSSPLDEHQASFTLAPPAGAAASTPEDLSAAVAGRRVADAFADLAARELTTPAIALALATAFCLGALHALSPGHGKTVAAAYLVGSRGTPWHAVLLGLTVTATHTIGVYALGLLTLYASRYVVPERLYPWLGALSGLLVLGIGVGLLSSRLRGLSAHSHHEHRHHSEHPHSGTHGLRGLLGLGISGGLVPCPSALVVLLSAISLHRLGFGLLLIVAFSLGLAAVLTGIGLALVLARGHLGRFTPPHATARLAPLAGALVIITAGAVITAQAIGQV